MREIKLFKSISDEELKRLFSCLNARRKTYKKGSYVISEGDSVRDIAILIEGKLFIQNDDYWGKRSILGEINDGDIFLEAYAIEEGLNAKNDVVASENSTVLFLSSKSIMSPCSSCCAFHNTLIKNLLELISHKNRILVEKISLLNKRSTREKVLSYLSQEAKKNKSSTFTIPFSREELAYYLSVDRSALSTELGKLRDEGLIEFKKSKFTLKKAAKSN